MQHCAKPLRSLLIGGQSERGSGRLDALFGPADSLGHGGLGHQERARDLRSGKATYGSQGESDRGWPAKSGMTAHEEQNERVILSDMSVYLGYGRQVIEFGRHRSFAAATGHLASQVISHAAGGDLDEPRARIVRSAFLGPLKCCCQQRFLDCIFGVGEVTETAN